MGLTMQMTMFTLPTPETSGHNDASMLDLLWAHMRPEDRVEHIRVRAGPGAMEVVLFLLASDEATATEKARDIQLRITLLFVR
ncbi:hypothetical protein ACL02O_23010 [Micromonospora sp. MS34]|uniref:hypothetical protein n=1 Tax=Micromonospora sp. MS34 TaxID=3385971 RepID=UPI0039A02499